MERFPSLCFMDLLRNEIVTNNHNIKPNHVELLYNFWNENGYDTDSVIHDVYLNSSNTNHYIMTSKIK